MTPHRTPRFQLSRLTRWSGREPRRLFWPWVACVMVANMIAGMVAGVPMFGAIARNMATFAARHPDRTMIGAGPGHYSMQIDGPVPPALLTEPMRWFVAMIAIVAVLSVLLLAASVVRRLHDAGRGGWWGLLPLPFLATGLIAFWLALVQVGRPGGAADMAPFLLLFGNNVAYLVALVVLVVQLCRPGDPGPNRFGPPLD
ncbi:DUF805 domain-containing protein [Sphingomonas hankookensis]|uniref:DUF805 domain-containing protein n=1 Tax=Sphingomonas hengshuiensis TaxID=1609977 RepID=A0A2W4Z5E4_9SPHN|nr:MAG: hypothetical protein DI632_10205 [Sphingomonas hengshuiensis]